MASRYTMLCLICTALALGRLIMAQNSAESTVSESVSVSVSESKSCDASWVKVFESRNGRGVNEDVSLLIQSLKQGSPLRLKLTLQDNEVHIMECSYVKIRKQEVATAYVNDYLEPHLNAGRWKEGMSRCWWEINTAGVIVQRRYNLQTGTLKVQSHVGSIAWFVQQRITNDASNEAADIPFRGGLVMSVIEGKGGDWFTFPLDNYQMTSGMVRHQAMKRLRQLMLPGEVDRHNYTTTRLSIYPVDCWTFPSTNKTELAQLIRRNHHHLESAFRLVFLPPLGNPLSFAVQSLEVHGASVVEATSFHGSMGGEWQLYPNHGRWNCERFNIRKGVLTGGKQFVFPNWDIKVPERETGHILWVKNRSPTRVVYENQARNGGKQTGSLLKLQTSAVEGESIQVQLRKGQQTSVYALKRIVVDGKDGDVSGYVVHCPSTLTLGQRRDPFLDLVVFSSDGTMTTTQWDMKQRLMVKTRTEKVHLSWLASNASMAT